MNLQFTYIACTFFLIFSYTINAQNLENIPARAEVTYAKLLGKTAPVRTLIPMHGINPLKRASIHDRSKIIPNFPGRRKNHQILFDAPPFGADPVRQSTISHRSSASTIVPQVNVEGIDRAFAGPRLPDANGDIGRDYYIQCVNASHFQVFDKQGNTIGFPVAFNTLWSAVGFLSAGDPIIIYDQEYDRWIFTEFPSTNQLLIAISETSDPMGSYFVYNFGTPRFPDYPKYAIWKNTIYLTTNEFDADVQHTYFLDREALINGEENIMIQRIEIPGIINSPGFMVATPIDWSGYMDPPVDADPMVMYIQDDAWGEVSQDELEIFSFQVDFENPDSTTYSQYSLPTAPFDSDACFETGFGFECIPHPASDGIDGLPWTIMHQSHYRNFGTHESIVLNFIVDATASDNPVAGIRWMELRRNTPAEDWYVFQEGTYSPDDGLHRFMASIAIDGAGNIGLAYNVASETEAAGIRFTGRRLNDAPGEMTVDEYVVATGTGAPQDDRFGDYSSMAVDPIDDRSFWFTGEYMQSGTDWGTKVLRFQLFRDTIDIGPITLLTPSSSGDLTDQELVSTQIQNFGIDTIYSFVVGFQLNNGAEILDTVDAVLYPDSIIYHQFNTTVDLALPGYYQIRVFTQLLDDTNLGNDQINVNIIHTANRDIGITSLTGINDFICGTEAPMNIEIMNFGVDTVLSSQLTIYQNMVETQTFQWNGSLNSGVSEIIDVQLSDLMEGTNEIMVVTSLPNNMTDEIMSNDTFRISVNAILAGRTVTFELIPDQFPDEITWELRDTNGILLYSGGPYFNNQVITETWCLSNACHIFTIFDAAGDGICCFFGQGSYLIKDELDSILIASDGTYGSQEVSTFCLSECFVSAFIDKTPESDSSANDGAIMINAVNGRAPYSYSLDGGITYQSSSLFTGLDAGIYFVAVRDSNDCSYRDTLILTACAMDALITVQDESGVDAGDGSISFETLGGTPPIMYSIDGGLNFQLDSIFSNLSIDLYQVAIIDALGCTITDTVRVDLNVSVKQISEGLFIKVFPNPTDGVFAIDISGLNQNDIFLPFRIYNNDGSFIQTGKLVKYNDQYKGQITIQQNPPGNYYLVFPSENISKMLRIVKQ